MGPLAGVKVLDLSKYGLSRYTSMIMGNLGAEVTVVEMQKNAGQILDAVSDDVGSLYIGTIAIRSALPLNGLSIAQLQVKDYRIDFLNKFPYNILKCPSSCESQLAGSRKILSE